MTTDKKKPTDYKPKPQKEPVDYKSIGDLATKRFPKVLKELAK
ncbi:hypothetical protein [Rhizobium sp. BK661]|nr:hypothetical protein [Rhizobium sp. BK661]MCS3740219.1 hypothetical protein [Rhizobium sp. BK661]